MKRIDIFYILIPCSLLIFIWIAFNIYHNAITSTIPQTTVEEIAPIPGTFDTQTLEEIKKREVVLPVFEIKKSPNPTSTASATTIPSLSPSPITTASATPLPTTIPLASPTIKP